jgi:hypothetical protein
LFFMILMFSPNKLTSSAQTSSWYVRLTPLCFPWTSQMSYS